jgi:FixJ family two-component response regulator
MERGRFISIVDDDPEACETLGRFMRSLGHEVATFTSAEEFLRSPHRSRTDCLILDLEMPTLGSLELMRILATEPHRIPAIILTTHASAEARRRALEGGAQALFSKPFEEQALSTAVKSALESSDDELGV